MCQLPWKVACRHSGVDDKGKTKDRAVELIPSGASLKITVDQSRQDLVVRASGRINVDSSPDLRNSLLAILSRDPLPRIVTVNLADVSYIETSGIATLIEALRLARHQQIGFCLQGLNGSVLRLFEVTGVLTLFEPCGREEKVS